MDASDSQEWADGVKRRLADFARRHPEAYLDPALHERPAGGNATDPEGVGIPVENQRIAVEFPSMKVPEALELAELLDGTQWDVIAHAIRRSIVHQSSETVQRPQGESPA